LWKGLFVKKPALAIFAVALFFAAAPGLFTQNPQRTIQIHARRFEFIPAEITVKKGETVTLSLISEDVPHSLLIEGLGVNQTIVKGHAAQVTFTPDKAGDFPGRCGRFCGSGHGSMRFVVHVTE
jgi:cytochrome c oxidase subunit 2